MRVGLDGKHQPGMPTLEYVRQRGYDGASFRSPENFTETLDEGVLREARAFADANGLYFELGVGRVNPYVFDKNPELVAWGEGDYRTGFRALPCGPAWRRGAASCGASPAPSSTASRARPPGRSSCGPPRTFLRSLAPFLRDVGAG